MASCKVIESQRGGAAIYHGDALCREKLNEVLNDFHVPTCIFYMQAEIQEFGFNRSSNFFWLRLKKKAERKIKGVGTVYADVEVTGVLEDRHVGKITGIKAKEILVAMGVSDMYVGVPTTDKVKFLSTAGFWRVHPLKAFHIK